MISKEIEKIAYKTASKSNQRRSKMSAIVLGKFHSKIVNKLLRAYNYNVVSNHQYSIHAEQHLVSRAARLGVSLKGSTVLVYRIKSKGIGASKPCEKCRELLIKAGVYNVIYYNRKEFVKEKLN
ncbi:MAG: hypothetical protein AABY32_03880 [Nanoarchaeota archaeon]